MADFYRPDNDAIAGDPWNTAFLSDRDVSGQVPINFVPHPGIFLTPACFGNGRYEDGSFEECFSNLLASEFRRFIIDIYWDARNRRFRLCPVELPTAGPNTTAEAPLAPQTSTTTPNISSSSVVARQVSSSNTIASSASRQSNVAQSSTTTASLPAIATTSPSGTALHQVGPYQCTDSLGIDTVIAVLADYIAQTSFRIQARLQFIIINLHAASTLSDPTGVRTTLSESELPNSNELIKNYLGLLGKPIYTPVELRNERKNLNNSWFQTKMTNGLPLLNYFTTITSANGEISTPDGWPSENYAQQEQGNRLLIGYGSIDSQIEGYNLAGDNASIFMPGVLQSQRKATLDSTGNVVSGCFYNRTLNQVDQLNSSWAVSSVMDVDQSILGYAADNLTLCGISPVLNYTLNNKPASIDYAPYQTFGDQALFSWASGEPKNATVAGQTASNVRWSCAIMTSTQDYKGHWRVSDCEKKHRVACREANQPYVWRISGDAVPFLAGPAACPKNTTFDVPRTGLENLYLYNHVLSLASRQDNASLLEGIWINFNSIRTDSCWVTTGPNGTCPYLEDSGAVRQRTIVVPTIAAFIVLLLTVLTTLVKCNTNRRKSKVRKRGEGGWDYEGVPS